jgi:glycosyltransferase involved in cell wall biosynthesis
MRFVASFRDEIENFGPDLLHTNGVKSHWVSAVFSPARLPLVVHVRDYLSERRISKHLMPLLGRRPGAIIANSVSVADDVRGIAQGIAVHPIHNAIDLARFSPGAGDPAWLASLAGMSPPRDGEICVALVATYARWKGQDLAIRALARLLADGTSCRLYIVGGPIYATRKSQFDTEELRALARAQGVEKSVGFVPFQVDTPQVYRSVDAVLQTSTRREAFGRTIVEAMACGKPVVISRAGGAAELFSDGQTALGFDPADPSALASALKRVVLDSDLRRRLGESARKRALEGFDRARLGGAVEEVYREVLKLP